MHIWDLRLSSAKDLHIQTDSRSTSAPKSTRPSAVKADDKIVSCRSIVKGRTVLFLSPSLPLTFPVASYSYSGRRETLVVEMSVILLYLIKALLSSLLLSPPFPGPREHWDEWEFTHLIKTSVSTVKNRRIRRRKEREGIFFPWVAVTA